MGKSRTVKQSGVIPYRIKKGKVQIMLVTSRSGKRWVIPKGLIYPGLSARSSAAKEALEEAGINGLVSRNSIGSYSYRKWASACKVKVYLMRVTKQRKTWQESIRTRRWLSVKEARKHVDEKKLKKLITEVGKQLTLNSEIIDPMQ